MAQIRILTVPPGGNTHLEHLQSSACMSLQLGQSLQQIQKPAN